MCPPSLESIAGSEEVRGTADAWVSPRSGHPKMVGMGEEIKFLCMSEMFSPPHAVTSVTPVGFSRAMN